MFSMLLTREERLLRNIYALLLKGFKDHGKELNEMGNWWKVLSKRVIQFTQEEHSASRMEDRVEAVAIV